MKLLDGGDRAKFDTPGDIEKSIESLASKETKRTARVSSCARFSFMLKRIYKSLDKTQASFPAALWLTDNFPLLEEAYFYINDRRKYRLPSADGLVSRAEEFADIIAQNSEKALDFESFSKYINVFQSNSYFSQDELWLLPKLITAAFFRRACRIGADIARINDQRSLAFRMTSKDLDINRIAAHSKNVYFLEQAYNLLRDTKPEAALSLINRLGISQEDIDEKINLTISLLSKLEISISACIDSIRNISKLDWTEKYEAFNCIDKILCAEKAGVYVKTDFLSRQAVRSEISRFAKRHNMSETSAAHAVVSAADRYARDISSMLFGSGKSELLKTLSKTEPKEPNMIFLYMFLTALVSVASSIIIVLTQKFYLALTLLQIVWALSIYVITRAFTAFIKPKRLLRYDYSSGIPESKKTLVVITALIRSHDDVLTQTQRLEDLYISNYDRNLRFALLLDFGEANSEIVDGDEELLQYEYECIQRLNSIYRTNAFNVFHRKRTKTGDSYIGWERKRGALCDLNDILLGKNKDLALCVFDNNDIGTTKYVITLDADTMPYPGSIQELIGIISHPLNHKYAIIAPRILTDLKNAKTKIQLMLGGISRLWSYIGISSELYQDLAGEGIYCGKGIYDVERFHLALNGKIPENTVLSHDLLEGLFAKCAFASDIRFYDSQPGTPESYFKRQHRWIRGDFQLIPYLFGHLGKDLSALDKWKIGDNLRRAWLPVAVLYISLVLLLFGRWYFALAVMIAYIIILPRDWSYIGAALLPKEAWVSFSAITITLYRVFISKKGLLDWTTAADAEKSRNPSIDRQLIPNYVISLVILLIGFFVPKSLPVGIPMILLFLSGRFVWQYLGLKVKEDEKYLSDDKNFLYDIAKRTYSWFTEYADEKHNFIAPDNVQKEPYLGAVMRTSPTNIGFTLAAHVSALDLGFIDEYEFFDLVSKAYQTISRLPKWHGHLYNWYSTTTLEALHPAFVSTVDSGNFCACALSCAQTLRELGSRQEYLDLSFNLESLVFSCDFTKLYDPEKKLLYIGYDAFNENYTGAQYDLLASEAQLTYYIAIAKGDLPVDTYMYIGRPISQLKPKNALISFSGTMFEYLMPSLFLTFNSHSLIGASIKTCVYTQKNHSCLGIWGISESGYYAFDQNMNYQYKAFGIKELSMDGRRDPLHVYAPYAAMLALPYDRDSMRVLKKYADMGMLDEHGFFEALQFDNATHRPKKVMMHMAHHQAMGLIQIQRMIGDRQRDRFARIPIIRAYSLLLDERMPRTIPNRTRMTQYKANNDRKHEAPLSRKLSKINADAHAVCSGKVSLLITSSKTEAVMDELLLYSSRFDSDNGLHIGIRSGDTVLYPLKYGDIEVFPEKAVYTQRSGLISASVTLTPTEEGLIATVSVKAFGASQRNVDVSMGFKPLLLERKESLSHPAFSDLFISAYAYMDAVVITRTKQSGEKIHMFFGSAGGELIKMSASKSELYDQASSPQIYSASREEPSSPITPYCLISKTVSIAPAQTEKVNFIIGTGSRDECEKLINRFGYESEFTKSTQLANAHAKLTNEIFHLTQGTLKTYGKLTALLLGLGKRTEYALDIPSDILFRFGISGDLPVLIAFIDTLSGLQLVYDVLSAHEFLSYCGVRFDVLFINRQGANYINSVSRGIEDIIRCTGILMKNKKVGSVYSVNESDLNKNMIDALIARANIALYEGVPLSEQVESLCRKEPRVSALKTHKTPDRFDPPLPASAIVKNFGYGGFTDKGSFFMHLSDDDRPKSVYSNVIANKNFGTVITQNGGGYTYYENSREFKITPFENDAASDTPQECIYIRDDENGDIISPTSGKNIRRQVEHMPGASIFTASGIGLLITAKVFVDKDNPIKAAVVDIENQSLSKRHISLCSYAALCLGSDDSSANCVHTFTKNSALFAISSKNPGNIVFSKIRSSGKHSYTCDKNEFLGSGGVHSPDALKNIRLSNTCNFGEACFAQLSRLELEANSKTRVIVLLGAAKSMEDALKLICDFDADTAYANAVNIWQKRLLKANISTGDPALDIFANIWLPYQVYASRILARAGYFQAGGAYGFRDQLQDAIALLPYDKSIAKDQILRCCKHQFTQGDVQHWWHEPRNGVRTRISDDLLFLPWAVSEYIKQTGDHSILLEKTEFLVGEELSSDENDRYFTPDTSIEKASVFEHCKRAIERAKRFGAHGLCLIGSGDWNDGMNEVGNGGKGESVWLSFFYIHVLKLFSNVCKTIGEPYEQYLSTVKQLISSIEEHAWDGKWYRRAFFDDGSILGTEGDEECRIDLIVQSWAVLSGAADKNRAKQAVLCAYDMLFDQKNDIVNLLDPPLKNHTPRAGYIQSYPKGVRENGGQYTHGAIWFIMALLELGENEKAANIFSKILPMNHCLSKNDADKYLAEPYVLAADVYSGEHAGRAGWTWYTGSAGWLLRLMHDRFSK